MTTAVWFRSHAHGDAAVESAYERFCGRTWVDWLGLYAFCAGVAAKIPEFGKALGDWVFPFYVAVLLFPLVAIALGVARAREAFVKVLRGRGSWTTAFVLGIACGALAHGLVTAASYAYVRLGGTVGTGTSPTDSFAYTFITIVVVIPIVEELIFQAGLQTRLNRFGATTSILLTTVAFTLFHLNVFDRVPSALELAAGSHYFFGLLTFACLRRWNGSLVALVIAHGVSNWLALVLGPRL